VLIFRSLHPPCRARMLLLLLLVVVAVLE